MSQSLAEHGKDTDLLIIGSGAAGLTLALAQRRLCPGHSIE